jgi:hypothetical protein
MNPEKELSSFGAMRGLRIVPVIVIGLAALFAVAMLGAVSEAGGVGGYVVTLLAVPAAIAATGWMRRADRLKVTLTDRRIYGVTRTNNRWVRFSVPYGDIESVDGKLVPPKIILSVRGHDKKLVIPMIRDFVALEAFLSEAAGLPDVIRTLAMLRPEDDASRKQLGQIPFPKGDTDLDLRIPLLREGLRDTDEPTREFFNENRRRLVAGEPGLIDWSLSGATIESARGGFPWLVFGGVVVVALGGVVWLAASALLVPQLDRYASKDPCIALARAYRANAGAGIKLFLDKLATDPDPAKAFNRALLAQLTAGFVEKAYPDPVFSDESPLACGLALSLQRIQPKTIPEEIAGEIEKELLSLAQ